MSTEFFPHRKIRNAPGTLSVLLADIAVIYLPPADAFANHALTEAVVLQGGVGGLPSRGAHFSMLDFFRPV